MPDALVTGANGFIGQHLCQQLVADGWDVCVLRRESSSLGLLSSLPISHKIGDITDSRSVQAAFDKPYDAVFHVAANTSVWSRNNGLQSRVNVDGTSNLVDAVKAAEVGRFIQTSTVAVYGFPHGQTIVENTPHDTDAYWINYFRSKARAEGIVMEAIEAGLDAVILSPAHVMGPLDRHNWSRMIRMVHENTLPGIPPGSGSFADAREVARAHINAVSMGRRGEKYLLGGENRSFAEVVRMIAESLEKPPTQHRVTPAWLLKGVARIKTLASYLTGREPDLTPESAAMISGNEQVDSSKAIAELNYRITPTSQLLSDTVDWMRTAGMLRPSD